MASQGRRRLARILTSLDATAHAASNTDSVEETVTLENGAISVTVALHGGFILSVCPAGRPDANPVSNRHFICCDRWGPASKAEQQEGMSWHGEAMREDWSLDSHLDDSSGSKSTAATMSVALPMAGLTVTRRLKLLGDSPVLLVEEDVTNTNSLGRVYNLVQHPTLGTICHRSLQAHVIRDVSSSSPFVAWRFCFAWFCLWLGRPAISRRGHCSRQQCYNWVCAGATGVSWRAKRRTSSQCKGSTVFHLSTDCESERDRHTDQDDGRSAGR